MVKIWKTGGFIVNTNIVPNVQYYNQSGHGTCLFGKTAAVKRMRFEDELWLQDCRYALPDDMVMFYKLYLLGNKIAMNTEVRFVHLDAGASLMSSDKKLNNIYASARNGFIFWHRFVYKQSKTLSGKSVALACFFRRVVFTTFFAFLKGLLKGGNLINAKTYIKGYGDGLKYVCSGNYKELRQLPPP